jgi:tRNA threonylcarbamoyl adenosine modification protein YeaZ
MDQLRVVVIAIGPGGFSALRVGLSTAKTLTTALDIPLVSVGTLDVEAQPYLGLGLDVGAVIGAGKQRVYVGRYLASGSVEPAHEVVEYEDLGPSFTSKTLFCGEGLPDVADMLKESLGDQAIFVDTRPPTRRASVLAGLGYRRWQAGEMDDLSSLQPLYLRSAQVDMAQRTWSSR